MVGEQRWTQPPEKQIVSMLLNHCVLGFPSRPQLHPAQHCSPHVLDRYTNTEMCLPLFRLRLLCHQARINVSGDAVAVPTAAGDARQASLCWFVHGFQHSGNPDSSLGSLACDLGRPGGSARVAIILPFWAVSTLGMPELSPFDLELRKLALSQLHEERMPPGFELDSACA